MVRRARQGDRAAIDALLGRMGCVRRFVYAKNARFGDPLRSAEFEDAVQDTLLAIWSKLGDYSGRGSLEAWMYRFSYLELLARLRSLRRFPRHLEDALGDSLAAREREGLEPFEVEQVYRALERLPATGAEIIRLKHFEDLTFEEIGARQEISSNTAKTRYYRGMRKLRDLFSVAGANAGGEY